MRKTSLKIIAFALAVMIIITESLSYAADKNLNNQVKKPIKKEELDFETYFKVNYPRTQQRVETGGIKVNETTAPSKNAPKNDIFDNIQPVKPVQLESKKPEQPAKVNEPISEPIAVQPPTKPEPLKVMEPEAKPLKLVEPAPQIKQEKPVFIEEKLVPLKKPKEIISEDKVIKQEPEPEAIVPVNRPLAGQTYESAPLEAKTTTSLEPTINNSNQERRKPAEQPTTNAEVLKQITNTEEAALPETKQDIPNSSENETKSKEPSKEKSKGKVSRSAFTTAVKNLEPSNKLKEVKSGSKLNYFTELKGLSGKIISHRWEMNNRILLEKQMTVGSNEWRVWSSLTLKDSDSGNLRVSVIDSSGNVINSEEITVTR